MASKSNGFDLRVKNTCIIHLITHYIPIFKNLPLPPKPSGSITTRKYPSTSLKNPQSPSNPIKTHFQINCKWEIVLPNPKANIFLNIIDFDFARGKLYNPKIETSQITESQQSVVQLTNPNNDPESNINCPSGYLQIKKLRDKTGGPQKTFKKFCANKYYRRSDFSIETDTFAVEISLNLLIKIADKHTDYYKLGKGLALTYFSKIYATSLRPAPYDIVVGQKAGSSGGSQAPGAPGFSKYERIAMSIDGLSESDNTMFVNCDVKSTNSQIMNYITDSQNSCLNLVCPAGCGYFAWQNDISTRDGHLYGAESRICRAAIHAGAIQDRDGGMVKTCGANSIDTVKEFYSNNLLSRSSKNYIRSGKPSVYFEGHTNIIERNNDHCFSRIETISWTSSTFRTNFEAPSADYRKYSAWQPENNDRDSWLQLNLDGVYKVTEIWVKGLITDMKNTGHITGFRMQVFNESLSEEDLDESNFSSFTSGFNSLYENYSDEDHFSSRRKDDSRLQAGEPKWRYLSPTGYIKKASKADYLKVDKYKGKDARFSFYQPYPVFKYMRILVEELKSQKTRALKVQLNGCRVGEKGSGDSVLKPVDEKRENGIDALDKNESNINTSTITAPIEQIPIRPIIDRKTLNNPEQTDSQTNTMIIIDNKNTETQNLNSKTKQSSLGKLFENFTIQGLLDFFSENEILVLVGMALMVIFFISGCALCFCMVKRKMRGNHGRHSNSKEIQIGDGQGHFDGQGHGSHNIFHHNYHGSIHQSDLTTGLLHQINPHQNISDLHLFNNGVGALNTLNNSEKVNRNTEEIAGYEQVDFIDSRNGQNTGSFQISGNNGGRFQLPPTLGHPSEMVLSSNHANRNRDRDREYNIDSSQDNSSNSDIAKKSLNTSPVHQNGHGAMTSAYNFENNTQTSQNLHLNNNMPYGHNHGTRSLRKHFSATAEPSISDRSRFRNPSLALGISMSGPISDEFSSSNHLMLPNHTFNNSNRNESSSSNSKPRLFQERSQNYDELFHVNYGDVSQDDEVSHLGLSSKEDKDTMSEREKEKSSSNPIIHSSLRRKSRNSTNPTLLTNHNSSHLSPLKSSTNQLNSSSKLAISPNTSSLKSSKNVEIPKPPEKFKQEGDYNLLQEIDNTIKVQGGNQSISGPSSVDGRPRYEKIAFGSSE